MISNRARNAIIVGALFALFIGGAWLIREKGEKHLSTSTQPGSSNQAQAPAQAQPANGTTTAGTAETGNRSVANTANPATTALSPSGAVVQPGAPAGTATGSQTALQGAHQLNEDSKKASVSGGAGVGVATPSTSIHPLEVATITTQTKTQAEPDACYTVSYKHKKLATHPSEDECSHHKNLVQLPRHVKDLASVCVRVNGKPVRHEMLEGASDAVVIGPVAGPSDLITAHFCVGTAKCKEACDYPKKEIVMKDSFLDAIGGSKGADEAVDDSLDEAHGGNWQQADAHAGEEVSKALDPEIRKELQGGSKAVAGVRKPASKSTASLEIFKEWLNEGEKTSCVKHD
ncbi:MAG: hypothetical protein P4M08_08455 [Oligoflexia bacterium]|nr:hypothetical protein [Oligoflexia bacterium]